MVLLGCHEICGLISGVRRDKRTGSRRGVFRFRRPSGGQQSRQRRRCGASLRRRSACQQMDIRLNMLVVTLNSGVDRKGEVMSCSDGVELHRRVPQYLEI